MPSTRICTADASLSAPRGPVLLVEDEPTIAITLADDLSDHGYEVVVLDDGARAAQWLAQRACYAVVTDLRLPGADGLAVLRAARAARTDVPVLVVSAAIGEFRERLLRAGACALLQKPFANARVIDWLDAQRPVNGDAPRPSAAS